MQQLELLDFFILPLEKSGIEYFVTGSVASIFYGEPRLTHDIDIVIHLPVDKVMSFIELFPEEYYYCPPVAVIRIELVRHSFAHFNLIHHDTGLKADIYPARGDELQVWAFQHKRRVSLGEGIDFWLAPPEYVIIRKLEYYREGGSQKHLDDIKKMLNQTELQLEKKFMESEMSRRELLSAWKKVKFSF